MTNPLDQSEDHGLESPSADELTILKTRARLMGVTFSNNISLQALRLKVKAKQESEEIEPEVEDDDADEAEIASSQQSTPVAPKLTKAQATLALRKQLLLETMKLVRLRITNLDPKKRDLPGEIFTVANEYIGTVRKYVPYGEVTDNGYHVPHIIYEMLKERQFLNIQVRRGKHGEVITHNWVKEFALDVLPMLTPDEVARLANAQAAAGGLDD